MLKTTCYALAAVLAGGAAAQTGARPDPSDPKAPTPSRAAYESAFKGYRPHTDPEVARWREANEEMGRLKGHAGHVPGSVPAASGPAPKAGHTGHGGHK